MSILIFLISVILWIPGQAEKYSERPRISVKDGHLMFIAPPFKNITFVSQSGVYVNNMDLLFTLDKAHNWTKSAERYYRSLALYTDRLDSLEQRFSEPIYVANVSNTDMTIIRRINRRMTALQRRVSSLESLLYKDECTSNPCKNGGICQDMFNGYVCRCLEGWEGPDCDEDVNECARFAGTDLGCQNGATCINKPGSYECICIGGFVGVHCTRRKTDCLSGSHDLCGEHGTCVQKNNAFGYKCICDQGYTNDGSDIHCVDVNECKLNHPPCSVDPPVQCINLPGSFYCAPCPPGFTGNGYHCIDIDECLVNNGGCSNHPMVTCINTRGSRVCGPCPLGYRGDGVTCTYGGGLCSTNNGGCHPSATCRENPNIGAYYVECICPTGYIGNGKGPNGCAPSPSYLHPCMPNPCKHGICSINNTHNYICTCNTGYKGRNCEFSSDNPCDSNPCLNGGGCVNIAFLTYKCSCKSGFYGKQCEFELPACGGIWRKDSGIVKYPASNFYSSNNAVSCAWTLIVNNTKVLNITFKDFNLKDAVDCRQEFFEIHDGHNSAAPTLGRFCGKHFTNGSILSSTHNSIYLWFRSTNVGSSSFEIAYEAVAPKCGGDLENVTKGLIQSPGFPGKYPINRDCYWKINSAQLDKRLELKFFSLQIGNDSDCTGDYIEVFGDASSDPHNLIRKICNSSIPEAFYTPGPFATVHFASNDKDTYPGFILSYSTVSGFPGCGGVLTSAEGDINPVVTESAEPCDFRIEQPTHSRIRITFPNFEVTDVNACDAHKIELYDGPTQESPLVGRFCGATAPDEYVSSGNQIFIVTQLKASKKWKIHYERDTVIRITDPRGVFLVNRTGTAYIIERPPGEVIEARISGRIPYTSLMRGASLLEVRDGDNEGAPLISVLFVRNYTVTSTYNALWLKKTQVPWTTGTVLVEYTAVKLGCGGILKNKMGNIASPSTLDGLYPHNITCTWIIMAPPKHIIQLSWLTFHLEQSYECVYDSIEIYDNNSHLGDGEMIGRYCGSKSPPVLFSSSNIMTVKFTSDTTLNTDGFLATYLMMHESSACGGNFFTSSGIIKSPGYPNPYPNNMECSWTINVRPGQQLLLTVEDFEMEAYPDCKYDYLEIRNGGNAASPLIGIYCGITIPKEIPSHTNQLYLHFKSDLSKDGRGFRITWSSTATGCGGTLTSPSGHIMSPHYPEPYNRYAQCNWRILINAGSVIQAVFSDIDMEKSPECLADYVELFDGGTRKSFGRYCSADNTKPVTSTKNEMLVVFRSDIAFQGRGFNLRYQTVCNNKITGFGGVIESPNFPSACTSKMDCTWEIVVPQGNKINITFSHFDVASRSLMFSERNTSACPMSYVEISYIESEEDESAPTVSFGKYCHDNPGHLSIQSNVAKIHFVNSLDEIGNQFRLEWKLSGCGGHLKGNTGYITSPNYPHVYPKNTKCEWLIEVAYGYSIEIEFQEIEVEIDPYCIYDHVKIYNGMDNTYTLLTTVCSQNKNTVVSTTGNFMFIEFQSDYSLSGRGFKANYSAIPTTCGGKFVANEGVITSPNYPQNYNKNETCEWFIEVDESHSIELVFEDLDLLLTNNCTHNYVKVFDGPSPAYPVLATVCGNIAPNKTYRSTYNNMLVEFVSHQLVTTKGFRAKYRKACGSRISTQSSGIISVGKDTLINNHCIWVISSTDPTQHVSLSITHLESTSFCEGGDYYDYKDYYVYDGDSEEAPLIRSYCGPQIPPTITSNGNSLTVKLSENIEFVATYSVFDSHCGGTFTAVEGYFSSPGYPKVYPTEIQCEWVFPSAPGNTLTINFIAFDLVDSENCNKDFLEVRSRNASGKLLGVYCGSNKPVNLTHQDSLWVFFRSSKPLEGETVINKGFMAHYGLSYENELTGAQGEIYSVMYPKMFKVNGQYSWRITVTERKKILLTFKEFLLDSVDEDFCYRSKINVYDGFDSESAELGEFCGVTLPKPIKSSSNVMFISAYVMSPFGIKFVMEWQEIDNYRTTMTKKSCGSSEIISLNSTASNYTLTSPGYPTGYAHNLECQWIFSTNSMNHLVISFIDVNFGIRVAGYFAANCQYIDVVRLYQKSSFDDDWQKIKNVCQSTSEVIHASNLLKVEFLTTRIRNGTGFKAYIFEGCGGLLTEPSGYIIFGENSTKGIECQWNITVRSTRVIDLVFEEIDIPEGPEEMCNSYLMVKNGISQESPFLGKGKYCGSRLPEKLTSTGNNLYVKYRGERNAKFRLRYQEVIQGCGREITLTKYDSTDELSSPNYPNIPTSHTECHWIITAPMEDSVRIDFEDRFDLLNAKSCTVEYVEIRDGGTESSAVLGRYCDDPPSSIISTGNMMFVKYFTDTDDPKNGFKAKVSIAACGGILRGTSGELTYKNQDNQRDGNCTWHLRGPMDHYWEIHFTHLSISSSGLCEKYVSVSENLPISSDDEAIELSKKYCGDKLPNNITTSGREAVIQFIGNLSDSFSLHYNLKQSECGGHLRQESGEFESPGYPQMNHVLRYCEWLIEVPEGRRVTLEFKDLDLDTGRHNYGIEVCDGGYFRICNSIKSTSDRKKESSSNKMTVYFYAGQPSTHRGFKASFSSDLPTICSGGFVGESGVIRTPTARNHSYLCNWVYNNELAMNKTLSLAISVNYDKVLKEPNPPCKFSSDGVRVYEKSPRMPLLKVCYTTASPVILRSPFPTTNLEVGISELYTLNYTVVYQIYNCGGIIRDQQGEIKTPKYPAAPNETVECAWVIEVAEGQTINLTAIDLDLGDDCEKSFLSIYNGGSQTKPRISKTCRKLDHPLNIISQSNELFIEYKFERGSKGKGVHLKFEALSTGCGGILHDKSRIISTPNYGSKDYPNNAECVWELHAAVGYHIVFQFQDRFHIEESEGCDKDYLEVWDWDDDVWFLQKKLCGRASPEVIKSKSDRLKLLFRTNDRITGAGFKGRADWDCGGHFVATKKPRYIVSPGYPIATTFNLKCVYEITASTTFFNINFLDFDLEAGRGSDCQFDNVTISRRYPYFLSRQIYCGTNLPPPMIMSNTAIITLKTDRFINGRGFKLMYSAEGCGGDIGNETEIEYTSNMNVIRMNMVLPTAHGCKWKITAPAKQIVVLRIVKLQLVDGPKCMSNLQIFNGLSDDQENRLGRFCGIIDTDTIIHSANNTMLVHLKTQPYYRSAVIFKAEVHFSHGPQEGCGGFINLTETKTITSPHLEKIDCSWIIVAPRDHQIIVNILDTRLPKSCNISNETCTCAFLEIHDGGSSLADLIEKICNNVTNKQFTTYKNMAFIRLVHFPMTQNAFRITLTPQMSVCGPSVLNVTNTIQTLTSPGYPSYAPVRCFYNFFDKGEASSSIHLHFVEFDLSSEQMPQNLQYITQCQGDTIEIIEDQDVGGPGSGLLSPEYIFRGYLKSAPSSFITALAFLDMKGRHVFCGKDDRPFDYYTSTNKVALFFDGSKGKDKGRGFKLEYSLAGCNRNYTQLQGRVSNGYNNTQCLVSITVPENRTISLFFNLLQLKDVSQCNNDALEIRDGSPTGILLTKVCGYALPDPVFSYSNKVFIHIYSKSRPPVDRMRYDISYTSTDKGRGCGGTLYGNKGRVFSPLYPHPFRNETTCTWIIRVPVGLVAVLRIMAYDLEGPCDKTYLNIVTHSVSGKATSSTLCPTDFTDSFKSKSYIIISYKSSIHNHGKGWEAFYQAVPKDVALL